MVILNKHFDDLLNSDEFDIREARKRLGLTVAQAASASGVSPSTFEAWESGKRNPSKDMEFIHSALIKFSACQEKNSKPIFARFSVKYCRELIGDTVEVLAKRVGVSPHTWRAFEQGRRPPQNSIVQKIESVLRERIEFLNSVVK